MRLIIGGKGQGKLDLLLQEGNFSSEQIIEGATCSLEQIEQIQILNHLHLLVRRWTEAGYTIDELYDKLQTAKVVICDEIGSGIVPMHREEEQWREDVGRLCCQLAKCAECVDRVFCGIGQRIKG